MPDVFISYNREDRDRARIVASALEAEGFSVWWDAALRAGETYDEVTELNLRQAGAVVVLWSKRSANSKWVRAEATVGERSSTLVPVLIEDCDRPIRFELVQTADLRHWQGDRNDAQWRAFIQDVRTAISNRKAKAPAAAMPAHVAPDASIETAFWNSVKDGHDRSDFEAYLARYPNGHFASLARNRIAALAKPAAPRLQPQPARPVQRAAPAAPQRAAPTRAAAPEKAPPPKKSGNALLFGGLAAVIVAVGVGGFMMLSGGKSTGSAPPTSQAAAIPSPPAAIAVADPADPAATADEDEAIVDVYAEGGEETPPTDDTAPIDIEGAPLDLTDEEELIPTSTADIPPATVSPTPVSVHAGKAFRDCPSCPQMATLPGGSFVMGSPETEAGRNAYEGPQREVKITPFAIGVYEVTAEEWNACAAESGCPAKNADAKFPALGVSWREASAYADWLAKKTGRKYRLPTESEWEYAARAGTVGAYWWGDRYDRARLSSRQASAVGSFDANAFGLHDVLGNAREWVADCYVNNFTKAPGDGSAVTDGDCGKRVIRGGAWSSSPADLRIANRSRIDAGVRAGYMGVRVAADVK